MNIGEVHYDRDTNKLMILTKYNLASDVWCFDTEIGEEWFSIYLANIEYIGKL